MILALFYILVGSLSLQAMASSPLSSSVPIVVTSGDPYDNGYSEDRFNFVLDHLLAVYSPLIKAQGGVFNIKRDWSDGAVNMWAERLGEEYWLEVPGGMARYHLISEEGFISSLCHELGHLIGGEPKSGKISFEGQSDYFAGRSCITIVLKDLIPTTELKQDPEIQNICLEDKICKRILSGIKSLTSYYAELENSSSPQFSTPSSQAVSETLTSHPPAQCRLDTFYAGFKNRPRPPCWYKEAR